MPNDTKPAARTEIRSTGANPVLVEVTRGPMVESRHRGSAVIVNAGGTVVARWGDHMQPVYPRSAVKPLQAIPLLETGAAEAFGLGDSEIALACASHGGEKQHTEAVQRWLGTIGRGVADLECGAQWPSHEHMAEETAGYVRFDHPVQQRILGTLEAMCGLGLGNAPRGVDGCAIPTVAIPLENLAYGMARFGAPDDLPPARAAACRRIAEAVAAQPFMVAGTGRYCTEVMRVTGRAALVKTGAEGVFCASLPDYRLGVALKCDDGTKRAAEVMMSAVLRHIGVLTRDMEAKLADWITVPVTNRNGAQVGDIRATGVFKG
jgi:L-asparaginase II